MKEKRKLGYIAHAQRTLGAIAYAHIRYKYRDIIDTDRTVSKAL